jgi:non-specific serine/threonine protein kinase
LRLTPIEAENRIDMLETIREYAAEQLTASSKEETETRDRHAAFYRDLAEASEGLLLDVDRDRILDRLDRELANFRAAIAWSLEARHHETGLRIAIALREFWHVRNRLTEGRRSLDLLLAASASEGPTTPRFRALSIGGGLAVWHGDFDRSLELFEEAAAMAEATGSRRQMAMAKSGLGWAMIGSRPTSARDHIEDAVALARELGDRQILFQALQSLTLVCIRLGDLGAARRSVLEAIALGEAAGESYSTELMLVTLGMIEIREGDPGAGGRRIAAALRQLSAAGGQIGLSIAIDTLATLVFERGEPERSARLAAAANRLRREVGGGPSNAFLGIEDPLDSARRTMAPADFERAVAEGSALTTDEAVTLGLEVAATIEGINSADN